MKINKLSPEEKFIYAIFGIEPTIIKEGANEAIRICLSKLTPIEDKMVRMNFGIIGEKEYTQKEIGDNFGVTRDRARQTIAKALIRLRHWTKQRILKPYIIFDIKNTI